MGNLSMFGVMVEVLAVCSRCAQERRCYRSCLAVWDEVPHPMLPDGWHVLDGEPICERHTIVIQDATPSA